MIGLKQYIEESLLDDFDTLSSNQDKTFNQPFGTLFRTADNGCNWDAAIQLFKDTISSEGKWNKSHPRGLAKNEVFVAFYTEAWQPETLRLYVRFNKTDFQPFKKSQGRSFGGMYKEPAITILGKKWNGSPMLNIAPAQEDTDIIKGGYLLSDKHAADALRMLQLMSEYKWNEKYW